MVGVGRSNRCVTGRRQRDNDAVRFKQRQRIGSQARDTQPIRGLGHLSGCKCWLSEEDMGQEVPSFSPLNHNSFM